MSCTTSSAGRFRILGYDDTDFTGWNLCGCFETEFDARLEATAARHIYRLVAVVEVKDGVIRICETNVPSPAALRQSEQFRRVAMAL